MSRRLTRSQRKELHRRTRIDRAIQTIGGRGISKRKINKSTIIMLFAVLIVFVILKFLQTGALTVSNFKPMFTVDRFENNYDMFINKKENKFDYVKEIETKLYPQENTISYIQKSTVLTGNYIQCYIDNSRKIVSLNAIGEYSKENDNFPVGFKENILALTAVTLNKNCNEAEDILINKDILDEKGNLYLRKIDKEIDDYNFTFEVLGNKFIFTITKI